jgi:DNA-directed RNA polymerase specialized sigma24 family protein
MRDRLTDQLESAVSEPAAGQTSSHRITIQIERAKAGERDALDLIWERYFAQLVRHAAKRLRDKGRPATGGDDEAAAAAALSSFWKRAAEGGLPDLTNRQDLLKLLCKIVRDKVAHQIRDELRQKRGGGNVRRESDLVAAGAGPNALDELEDHHPPPTAEHRLMAEEVYQQARQALADDRLQTVFDLMVQGETVLEIVEALDWSRSTVQRYKSTILKQISTLFAVDLTGGA